MLVSLKVNNVLIYDAESEFSMRAVMRASRLQCNVVETAGVSDRVTEFRFNHKMME